MRVIIDVSPAVQAHGGMGRYAQELAKAMLAVDDRPDLRLFYADAKNRRPTKPLDLLPRRTLRLANKPWRMSVLLATMARVPLTPLVGSADVFHATDHLLPQLRGMRTVFTLHDLAFLTHPGTHLALNRWFLRTMMPSFLNRADAVICVSSTTRNDARRIYGLDKAKTFVIPEGVSEAFRPVTEASRLADVRAKYHLPQDFILCVSTIEPRKNLITLLHAYELFLSSSSHPHHLVIVGRRGWKAEGFFAALGRSPAGERVLVAGQVEDEDMPAVYSAASLFVYPSLYEGFGLPPLEALACGTPVIASSAAALIEVAGDAGLLVDPNRPQDFATAMVRLVEDEALRRLQRAKGLQRAKLFTWDAAARHTLDVYREVLRPSARNLT